MDLDTHFENVYTTTFTELETDVVYTLEPSASVATASTATAKKMNLDTTILQDSSGDDSGGGGTGIGGSSGGGGGRTQHLLGLGIEQLGLRQAYIALNL